VKTHWLSLSIVIHGFHLFKSLRLRKKWFNEFITIKINKMETVVMTNKEIAQALYGYFGDGDVLAILNLLTDDIKWTCPGPTEILPYARIYKGKQEVGDFFRLINENKEFPKFEPRTFIAEGDKVVTLGYWEAKSRKTGKAYSGDWAMAFYFRDGKVCEHKEYYDTYGEAMASRG
jgi:uncharacterized protein